MTHCRGLRDGATSAALAQVDAASSQPYELRPRSAAPTAPNRGPMRRLALSLWLALALTAPTALAAPRPEPEAPALTQRQDLLRDVLRSSDFRPSAKAKALAAAEGRPFDLDAPFLPRAPMQAAALPIEIVGEIAVLHGDDGTVTDFGGGDYGLRYDNAVQDPMAVAKRVVNELGDVYDFIAVWTAFWDNGADGLAYYVPIFNDVSGIGEEKFNQRQYWGVANSGKLQGFLNMKSIDVYGNIASSDNYVYPVIGQEFSHRWLAKMLFQRVNGQTSDAMLGRDMAHWSSLLQAQASVQDGNEWRDNGDGTFSLLDNMSRYSELDLYGMGIITPDEVSPFFLIEGATYRGQSYDGLTQWPNGVKISGTRTNIDIDSIIAANGIRKPAAKDAQKDFRMAFVLVTAPGQTTDQVADQIQSIETFREIWEQKFKTWTGGRASICTRVTAACDSPALHVAGETVRELEGDGDGMAEPGERLAIDLTISNDGGGPAVAPRLHLTAPEGSGVTIEATPITIGDLAAGERATLEQAFVIDVASDAACGQDATLGLEMATGDLLTEGEVVVPIGFSYAFRDDFESDLGWKVNAQGADTATGGPWERATPTEVGGGGATTQPGGDARGAGAGKALVTGAKRGNGLGAFDVDGGATSVTSPSIAIAGAYDPHVSYASWRIGLDFNSDPNYVLADDHDPLVAEISPDEGATWVRLEADVSNEQRWLRKSFRVLDVLPSVPATLRIRFTMTDADPQSLAEAAIDEVGVWDVQTSCYDAQPEPGPEPTPEVSPEVTSDVTPAIAGKDAGGCGAGGSGALPLAAAVVGLALAGARRRRA